MGNLETEKYLCVYLEQNPQYKIIYDSIEIMEEAKKKGMSINADIHYGKNVKPGCYVNGISCMWSNPGANINIMDGDKSPVLRLQTCIVSDEFSSSSLFIRLDDVLSVNMDEGKWGDGYDDRKIHMDLKGNMSCDLRLRILPRAS